jgi:hypothetical protein
MSTKYRQAFEDFKESIENKFIEENDKNLKEIKSESDFRNFIKKHRKRKKSR